MAHDAEPMLVVGAGPTGLVMACELIRHGVPCRVVDENATRSDKSKAIGVHSRSLEIWESIGVTDAAIEAGRRVHGTNLYSAG
jgi:2-polyprenyl-6-methoxyphenol hydroxylase-like FAD-dependent oxidoreductase